MKFRSLSRAVVLFWIATQLPTPANAVAGSEHVWGRVYFNANIPTQQSFKDPPRQTAIETWGVWEKTWNDQNSSVVNLVVRGQAHSEIKQTPNTLGKNDGSVGFREAYHRFNSGGFKLLAGQQIISWGKADGLNPTDFLSARDPTKLNSNDEVKRIGAPAVLLNWIPQDGNSPFGFTFVWNIYHPQSRPLVPTSNLPSGLEVVDGHAGQASIRDSEFALKTSYVGTDWDIDGIVFRGWNHQPYLSPTVASLPFRLSTVLQQLTGVGTNLSLTRGAWVYRLEAARTYKTDLAEYDGSLSRSQTQIIAGFERKLFNDWRLNSSFYFRRNEDWQLREQPLSPTAQLLYQVNRVIQGENVPTRIGSITRLAYDPEDSKGWSGETLFIYYGYQENSFLIQPKITYAVNDSLKLSAGLYQAKGRSTEPIGFLKALNSYFFETQYFF
jgi:hypothetical protein